MKSPKELHKYQDRMKRRPTNPERNFSLRLQRAGIDFKPQMILGFYIIDFVLPAQMLCIEIDDPSHNLRKAYDLMRDRFCESVGFRVLRIKNDDATTHSLDSILKMPTQSWSKFRSSLALANIHKGLSKHGLSTLPTIGQSCLFQ